MYRVFYLGYVGQYVYFDSGSPDVEGEEVTLLTKTYTQPYCMSFWYNMHGEGMGTLTVKIKDGSILFRKTGAQGNQWLNARIDVKDSLCKPYRVSETLF